MIQVNTYGFNDLYRKFPYMVVPDYQRAYTWNIDKVEALIRDWEEYLSTTPKQTYYIGKATIEDIKDFESSFR